MSLSSRKTTVERLLKSKEYRDAYVLEHIKNGIAFQIRTLREDRDWTQGDLGDAMGKPRNVISRIEDPNYGKTTLTTLREVAAAFDVGLLVKFVTFSRLVREYEDVSPARLSAPSIMSVEEVAALTEWAKKECVDASLSKPRAVSTSIYFTVHLGGNQPTLFGNTEKVPLRVITNSTGVAISPSEKTETPIVEIAKENSAYAGPRR
jgi:transcriptional regulator with XRE-family HTH domain